MKDDFEQYRIHWEVNTESLPHLHDVHTEVSRLRRRRKNKIILWYSSVLVFSLGLISYVIYTDELNSVYKSISEFLLLLASVSAFRNSWKNIHHQKQEYALNNVEFIHSIINKKQPYSVKKIVFNLLFISILSVSVFMYFLETLLADSFHFWVGSVVLVMINLGIWLILKPIYLKQNAAKNHEFLSLLQNNNEKHT